MELKEKSDFYISRERKIGFEEVRRLLSYDSGTGVFKWIVRPNANVFPDDIAGGNFRGYRVITINKIGYYAHRLAWLYVHQEWPRLYLDHINGNKADNRISNLRLATPSENSHNQKRHRSQEVKGCHFVKDRSEWIGKITCRGKSVHLGYYESFEKAHLMYLLARENLSLYHGCQKKFREDISKLGKNE